MSSESTSHVYRFFTMLQILHDIGYRTVIADGLRGRFEHEHFLPIDLLVSPVFAPDPCETNRIHYERGIYFCTLPSKFSSLFSTTARHFLFSLGQDEGQSNDRSTIGKENQVQANAK